MPHNVLYIYHLFYFYKINFLIKLHFTTFPLKTNVKDDKWASKKYLSTVISYIVYWIYIRSNVGNAKACFPYKGKKIVYIFLISLRAHVCTCARRHIPSWNTWNFLNMLISRHIGKNIYI